jgi:hypothetical protein
MPTRRHVLRVLGAALLAVAVVVPTGDVAAQPKTSGDRTVYVTRTGTKYHRGTCRHLARSKIAMSLQEAAKRYGACGTCRPPRP